MKLYYKEVFWLLAFGALFTLFAYSTLAEQPQNPPEVEWRQKMQDLSQSLNRLLTYMSSDEEFEKPSNREKIASEIKNFSQLAHHIEKNKKMNNVDPSLPILSGYLNEDAESAYIAFKEGRRNYARSLMRSVTANCIACHTRNSYGPQFDKIDFEPTGLALKPIDRARFYSASRQFDRAVEEFLLIAKSKNDNKISSWDKEDSIREALAIAVRVKKDPLLSDKVIQTVLEDPNSPYYMKKDAESWKLSIQQWKSESKSSSYYREANRLLNLARKTQKFSMDHSADVLYLRASAAIFDLLQQEPNGKHVAEAFQLQGICYESLNPKKLENLNQLFYESCIKKAPHTNLSADCYRRLEQSIYIGFTGSSGTEIPENYKSKLLELWSIALPKEKLKAPK